MKESCAEVNGIDRTKRCWTWSRGIPDQFRIVGLSARRRTEVLARQCDEHSGALFDALGKPLAGLAAAGRARS